jgi:hypothetical protein
VGSHLEPFLDPGGSGIQTLLQARNCPVYGCFHAVFGVLHCRADRQLQFAGNTIRFLHNYLPINVTVLLLAYVHEQPGCYRSGGFTVDFTQRGTVFSAPVRVDPP